MPQRPPNNRLPANRARTGIRRPRVAGTAPAAKRPDADHPENLAPDGYRSGGDQRGNVALDDRDIAADTADTELLPTRPATVDLTKRAPSTGSGDTDPGEARRRRRAARRAETAAERETAAAAAPAGRRDEAAPAGFLRTRRIPLLAGALALFVGLAVLFGVADASVRGTAAAQNTALVDVGATAEASGQLSDALEAVYSYDFTRLDENERAARDAITPAFAAQFDQLFAQVRELAPQRQAVVSATVTLSAVQSITGDRAVLVAFMDQQATTAVGDGGAGGPQQLAAAGRLTVTGEKVDGRWRIADVQSR